MTQKSIMLWGQGSFNHHQYHQTLQQPQHAFLPQQQPLQQHYHQSAVPPVGVNSTGQTKSNRLFVDENLNQQQASAVQRLAQGIQKDASSRQPTPCSESAPHQESPANYKKRQWVTKSESSTPKSHPAGRRASECINTPSRTISLAGNTRKRRRIKNPLAPKHPMSAFLYYLSAVRPSFAGSRPGAPIGSLSNSIAEQWRRMSPQEKMPWEKKAREDKERYAREMEEWFMKERENERPPDCRLLPLGFSVQEVVIEGGDRKGRAANAGQDPNATSRPCGAACTFDTGKQVLEQSPNAAGDDGDACNNSDRKNLGPMVIKMGDPVPGFGVENEVASLSHPIPPMQSFPYTEVPSTDASVNMDVPFPTAPSYHHRDLGQPRCHVLPPLQTAPSLGLSPSITLQQQNLIPRNHKSSTQEPLLPSPRKPEMRPMARALTITLKALRQTEKNLENIDSALHRLGWFRGAQVPSAAHVDSIRGPVL